MKTNKQNSKSTIDELRSIREQIGEDIKNMSLKELKEYFKQKKSLHPKLGYQREQKSNQ